ncbi:universal stress protein [Streptomyces minutiscleroticus]|uniref:Universal stress protein n=1 Tax=Streptomyces minutiscleroticus TaxID=68238 RepID=A0A918NQU2_9ACTN|nr:universal stress protein [Streptomyces minutiscleroticus]GGX88532.1 universal stress protein [Streptomyces minutiscleroticus]
MGLNPQLPLVVGVDGSEASLRAVDWAAEEAALRGVPLRLVHASLWERYEGSALSEDLGEPDERTLAEAVVEAAARRAHRRRPGVPLSTDILPEEPEHALVRESRHSCALVVGGGGRGGASPLARGRDLGRDVAGLLLGSVSLAVAAHADCPVIVFRGGRDGGTGAGDPGRVVLGVGDGTAAPPAVRFAFQEAAWRGVLLEAVRAWRCPAHGTTDHPLLAGDPARSHERRAAEDLAAALRGPAAEHPGVAVRPRTVEGHARKVLVDVSHGAGLLVVGAGRHAGHFGFHPGRVTHGVLHHATCPVAVVPQKTP